MDNFRTSPKSRKQIREIAKELREILGVLPRTEIPIVKIIEFFASGLESEDFTLEICDKQEMKEVYALTMPREKVLKIREDTYMEACSGNPRHLLTICHELGHVILHRTNTVVLARNERIKKYEDPEWQANTFAAELMVPADEVKGMTVEEIMYIYNCSYTVASIQLQQSKYI